MNQLTLTKRHCLVHGGWEEVEVHLDLAQPSYFYPSTSYQIQTGLPLPICSDWGNGYHRSLTPTTLSHHSNIHWSSSHQKGQNILALASVILIVVLKLSTMDGIPKAPAQPCPSWNGPGSEILSSPFSPKENKARRMEERLVMREKRRTKKEKGGFRIEFLHMKDEQDWGAHEAI